MEGISWKRAYAGSLLIHLAVAGLLAVGLAGSVTQHEQERCTSSTSTRRI